MSYATLAELKAWMTIPSADTGDDADLQRALDAADRWIDQVCGRKFSVDAQDVTKLLYPNARGRVDVVDLVSVTSIKTDSRGDRSYATTLATTDYILLPSQNPDGETRYQEITIWPTASKSFGQGRLVQVVGKFGYVVGAAAPKDIVQAELIQASRLWKRTETPLGVLGATDLGTFQRISAADPDVMALLAPYVRSRQWVVA